MKPLPCATSGAKSSDDNDDHDDKDDDDTNLILLFIQARTRTLTMEGLLKLVATSSHSTEGRKISQSSPPPSAFQDSHMTVSQVSRDFSSLSMAGLDREDLVAFLVGETFDVLVAPCGVMFCCSTAE